MPGRQSQDQLVGSACVGSRGFGEHVIASAFQSVQGDRHQSAEEMVVLRLLSFLIAAVVLLPNTGVYYARSAATSQKERAAHPNRAARFHYVCPMHADVTSNKRGSCHKCKMALVKKTIAKTEETNSGSGAQHQH